MSEEVIITKQEVPDTVQVIKATRVSDNQPIVENPAMENKQEANGQYRKRKKWINLLIETVVWIKKNGDQYTHQ